jgi:hypothetical protein
MLVGFRPQVAKSTEPLIQRADKVIDRIDSLRIEVVVRERRDQREARLRRLDLQSGRRR